MHSDMPARIESGHAPLPAAHVDADLVGAIMATLNARTARTYLADYRDFARFLHTRGPQQAVELLISMSPGAANACALAYRVWLTDRGLAAGTIARRLAALRSACRAARRIGRIAWGLDVPGPRPTPYRDTRGPGTDGWRRMLAVARERAEGGSPKALRDLALVRLLSDLALRRGEAVGLDTADVDIEGRGVQVIGKGKTEAVRLTLPGPTAEALSRWLAAHPDPRPDVALFVRLDTSAPGTGRLTGEAVRLIVAELGRAAGLARVPKPHGLRHRSITAALDAGRDVRDVRKFSRHARLETVLVYDDSRRDVAGDIASLIAGE